MEPNCNTNIICLQETLLKETDNITFKRYDTYNQTDQQETTDLLVAPQL